MTGPRRGVFKAIGPILISDGFVRGHCPFHDDSRPSATLQFRDGRPVRFTCFAGCGFMLRVREFRFLSDDSVLVVISEIPVRERAGRMPASASLVSRGGKGRDAGKPGSGSENVGLLDRAALDDLLISAVIEVERIIDGLFVEDPGALEFWSAFMRLKRVGSAWIDLPNRPLCGIGLYYRLHGIGSGEVVFLGEHLHVRLNSDFQKSFFHRPFHRETGSSGDGVHGLVPLYSPLGFPPPVPHPPVVLVEAPQHAVRLAVLTQDVFPVSAMGISGLRRLFVALREIGFAPRRVFADEHPPGDLPSRILAVSDLDLIDDANLLVLLRHL